MSMMDDSRPQGGGGVSFNTMETNQRLLIVAVNSLPQVLKIGFANTFPINIPVSVNNLGTSSIQVIGADPTRSALTFHNPGSATIIVCPSVNSVGSAMTASFTTRGGGFIIGPGETLPFSGICQTAWNAIANSGAANGLTISSV